MGTKKLVLAAVSVLCLTTSAHGAWPRVKCLGECTKIACADNTKKEACFANCPALILKDSCSLAQGVAVSPQQPAQKQNVQPVLPPTSPTTGPSANLNLKQSGGLPSGSGSDEPAAGTEPPTRRPVRGIPVDRKGIHPRPLPQPTSPRGQAEPGPKLAQASDATYTIGEVNETLKMLLSDSYREVTTGCNTAKTQIESGIKMINSIKDDVEAIDLVKRGIGFIVLIEKEMKDAKDIVEAFKITEKRLSPQEIKSTFQKSQEKSLLAAQDCKVKHAQYQGWLNDYLAKHPSGQVKKATSSGGFLGFGKK